MENILETLLKMWPLWLYLFVMSIVTFIVYMVDKRNARRRNDGGRVPETALLTLAFLGGGLGALFAMWFGRHKTRHVQFIIGIPLSIVIWIIVLVLLFFVIAK